MNSKLTFIVLVVATVGDRCNSAEYQPSRIRIIDRDGLQYKRPMSTADGYAYPTKWETLNVKGIGYSPVPTDWKITDQPHGDFFGDKYDYIWRRDIKRMKDMGANVIRVWNWNFIDGGSHFSFLDAVFENDMFVLIPFMMGTLNDYGQVNYEDLASIDTRKKLISDWKVFIETHMHHPAVLGFLVGNEVEKTVYHNQMEAFFSVLNLMISTAHRIEGPNRNLLDAGDMHYHPITTPFAADTFGGYYHQYYDWIGISFWALQVYSDNVALENTLSEYRNFMNQSDVFGRRRRFVPILLTERGFSALTNQGPNSKGIMVPVYDTNFQANQLVESWNVVEKFHPHCAGMVVMEWNDEWWKGQVNDVRNPGCPNPLTNEHSNCSTVISAPNGAEYQNFTLVFEEWLGIHEQQEPKQQPIATTWVSIRVFQEVLNFIAPVKQFCIRPRPAYFRLQERWTNSTPNVSAWLCAIPWIGTRIWQNPVVLVIVPTVVILVTAIIVTCLRCGARAIEISNATQCKTNATNRWTAINNTESHSASFLSQETQEMQPQRLIRIAAVQDKEGHECVSSRNMLDPHIKHLRQLIFDKIDWMSLQEREQEAKSYIEKVVMTAFTQEVQAYKEVSERFQVSPAPDAASPAPDAASPAYDNSLESKVIKAVQVVWYRYMEGYRLWLRRRGGLSHGEIDLLNTTEKDLTESDRIRRMVKEMTILILLRCVAGTMNHAPEFMMFLLHELYESKERASQWAGIIRQGGVLDLCYKALKSTDPIMSIEDFNAFGLDKSISIDKINSGEYTLNRKSFPERGGLHVIIVNYLWLIRLFLWMWLLAWYYQPVNLGHILCVRDVTSTLASIDAFLYSIVALAQVSMLFGSKLYCDLGLSIVMGLLHFGIGVLFSLNVDRQFQVATFMGIVIDLPTVYLIVWAVLGTVREVYLFSQTSFGEHHMQGTAAVVHGRPRLAFGIFFGIATFSTFVITILLTRGNLANAISDENISSLLISWRLVLSSVLFVFLMCLGAGVSGLVGKITGDRRSVVGLAPTLFWSLFAVICAVVNIYWLVPSVTNLGFSVCQCDAHSLGFSDDSICDARMTVACGLAVVFTWVSTLFVSFVVSYAIFALMSLVAGIAVAKTSQIGAVRNWEDVSRFGDKIIKTKMQSISKAARNFDVAATLWNAFIDSMFVEYLLTARERDQYMYQTIAKRFFCLLANFYKTNANPSSAGAQAPPALASEASAKTLIDEVLKIIVNGRSNVLQQIKDAILQNHLPDTENEERKQLYHNIEMALTLDGTCPMSTIPIKLQDTASSMLRDIKEGTSQDSHFEHPLLYFIDCHPTCPPYIKQVLDLAETVNFGSPPRNSEAVRRIVHFLWSLDAARLETEPREDPTTTRQDEADILKLSAFHRVATMPSCTTIIPYYNETITYTWKELTETLENNQPRVSFVEYVACQFPNEWENFAHDECWREDIIMFDRGGQIQKCNGKPCQCGSLFLAYLLCSPNIPEERKDRVSMFVTYRGQTLGRTLRGLETFRRGMKVLAFLEEKESLIQVYKARIAIEIDEKAHEFCWTEVKKLVDSKYQVIVAAQMYTPRQRRNAEQAEKDLQLDRLQRENNQAFTFDIVCNVDKDHMSFLVPCSAPDTLYSLKRPGTLRVDEDVPTEGKAENQLHAVPFAIGEVINTLDMNQDHTIEMGFKHPLLVSLFWNPKPSVLDEKVSNELDFTPEYRIVGFAEHTYTRPLSMVGELMGAAEFCFVTITQRVLARPLGVRAHYGHPDYLDGYWVRTRGGGSKASHNVNVNEDIFCGYEMIARGQKITFIEWMQAQKGRESAFGPAYVFEAKLAGGAGQQVRSRDVYFLNRNLDIMQRLSVAFGTLGFYFINVLMAASIRYFVWAIILFRVAETTFHELGVLQAKIAVAWVLQLGFVLALPLFIENFIEHGLARGCLMFLRTLLPSLFFFVFHLQTKFYFFIESIIHGKAEYMSTGRGFALDRMSLVTVYKTFGESHTTEALKYLVLLLIYRYLSTESAFSYVLRCFTVIIIVISWFAAPLFFQPFPTSDRLEADWVRAKQWLFMPCVPLERNYSKDTRVEIPKEEAETSWEAWFVLMTSRVWENEETAYHFAHITVMFLATSIINYLPWAVMFSLHVSQATLYLVAAILAGQLMHLVLVGSISPSQHHYLGVVDLLMLTLAVPLIAVYYALVSVSIADIVFGACIYFVALGFWGDVATLGRRIRYRFEMRNVTPPEDREARKDREHRLQHRRQQILMGVAKDKRLVVVISMFILYIVSYILCWFKVFVTAVNYSHAAAFAWERVYMQPREVSVTTAEPIDNANPEHRL